MFEDYVKSVEKEMAYNAKQEPAPTYTMNFSSNVLANPELLSRELANVETMDNAYLYDMISKAWHIILDKEFIDKNKVIIAKAFTNEKFVVVFSQVMSQVKGITKMQQISCNRLVYDYLTLPHEKDVHIQGLLYNLGMSINREIIPGLMGLGLDTNTVANLAIARFSTEKEQLAVKRVNVIIVNGSIDVMTEQMIVKIYEKLFDHLVPLFEGIMFDKWNEDIFQDEEEMEEIYGLINLAILDILNEMPTEMIYNVLTQYAQTRIYLHSNSPVRFNIHSISSDYGRIIQVIDQIESTGELLPSA